MLYEDELTRENLFSQYGRRIISIDAVCDIVLLIFTGSNITYNNDGTLLKSTPEAYGLPLNEYSKVVIGLYDAISGRYLFPSECLKFINPDDNSYFDYLFNVVRGKNSRFSHIDLPSAEKFYIKLCKICNLETKSKLEADYFCSICEAPLQYNIGKCWTCERGL